VEEISRSIVEAVETGKLLRPALLQSIEDRIEKSRTLIADVPLVDPRILGGGHEGYARDMLTQDGHVSLSGIGGAGKTICAAITAHRAAMDGRTLPLLVTVTHESTRLEDLILRGFSAIRFQLGTELLTRWAHEGRLFVVVDGIEAVEGRNRRRLMNSIAEWGEQYPRSGIVVCARQMVPGELDAFMAFSMAPISASQLHDMAIALGLQAVHRFPEQVADLARWPMWATALLVYGPQSHTGLELLQTLIEARLRASGMSSALELEELRSASTFLAHEVWPDTECTAAEALTYLATWSATDSTRMRFEARTAEDLLGRLGQAGLVEIGSIVSFPHRLFATILASEYASKNTARAINSSPELSPFVAALLDDDRHSDVLTQLLGGGHVFAVARFLRLSPPHPRSPNLETDVARMINSLQSLSHDGTSLQVITGEEWIAWRESQSQGIDLRASDGDYMLWRSRSNVEVEFWPFSPFLTRTPEFIAAIQVLRKFRREVLQLDPGGNPHGSMPSSRVRTLLKNKDDAETLVLQRLSERREAFNELVSQLGMSEIEELQAPKGEPQVMIHPGSEAGPWMDLSWADQPPQVTFVTSEASESVFESYTRMGVDALLSNNAASAAYATLTSKIEGALGCRLTSQAWERPELISAWAW
jgi:hypothetical protein